jgi:hypothetical protein
MISAQNLLPQLNGNKERHKTHDTGHKIKVKSKK